MENVEFQQQAQEIEELVGRVNALVDDDARTTALELMQSLMDLHGAGISRIVELLSESGEANKSALAKLSSDPLLCGLFVLYDVHPVALEQRVRRAIENAAPQLRKQGGSVELLAIEDGAVRIAIKSSGNGCHSSPDALKETVERAIREAAPEVVEVIAEGLASSAAGFVPLNMIQPAITEEKKYEESTA
jgi:Fe-S cluster biogenesis protein NfuA